MLIFFFSGFSVQAAAEVLDRALLQVADNEEEPMTKNEEVGQ